MGGVTPRQWLKAAGEFTDSHGRGKDNTTFNLHLHYYKLSLTLLKYKSFHWFIAFKHVNSFQNCMDNL